MPKPSGNNGKPGGIDKYFDRAIYNFEYPYRMSWGLLPPADPRADNNYIEITGASAEHRRSYDPKVGGYYRFRTALNNFFDLHTNFANGQSEIFMAALIRVHGAGGAQALIGRGVTGWSMQWWATADGTILARAVTTAGTGAGDKIAQTPSGMYRPGQWALVMYGYKANSYIKAGVNGRWVTTTAHASNTLRNDATYGLSIGRFGGSTNSNADIDIAFLGLGTAVPTDRQTNIVYNTLMSSRDTPSGSNESPGGSPPLQPFNGFTSFFDYSTDSHRLKLAGLGPVYVDTPSSEVVFTDDGKFSL
jgi:hypothetical protein